MKNTGMIIFQDAKSGMYWDGKAFAADIKEKALAYPHEQERAMLKILPSEKITIHGYVSSSNLKAEAQKGVEVTHARKLDKLADEVIHALASAGEKYLGLCTYIRENEVTKKLVSFELGAKGFTRQTISKINTVANLPEEQWSDYAARRIGFNKVLALGSGTVQEAISNESGESVVDVQAEVKRLEETDGEETEADGSDNGDLKTDWNKKLVNAASMVLRAAAALQLRGKSIPGGNGYKLVIVKVAKANEKSKGKKS